MDHVLSNAGLRLSYLCDSTSIRQLDAQKILDDLSDLDTQYALAWWFSSIRLEDFDHVVVAADCETGRYVAILAANDGATETEPYLSLQASFVIDAMHDSMLLRRMLAYTVLRIAGIRTMPRIVTAQTSTPTCYLMLSLFAQAIPGAKVFPEPGAAAVDLRGAGLARRIARSIAPYSKYSAATATITGSRMSGLTCFGRAPRSEQKVDDMFATNLGGGDQMMVVIDMRDTDETILANQTRKLVRAPWKGPIPAMRAARISAASQVVHRTPTLTA